MALPLGWWVTPPALAVRVGVLPGISCERRAIPPGASMNGEEISALKPSTERLLSGNGAQMAGKTHEKEAFSG